MDKNTAEEISTVYKRFKSNFPIKLYFIVRSLNNTERTQGLGGKMHEHLNQPLEFHTMGSKLSLILIMPDNPNRHLPSEYGPITYYYDYRDLDLTAETEKFIKSILKPKKIAQPSLSKFDEKNIYNFNKNNKQK